MTDPLAALPPCARRRLAVKVTKDAMRHVRAGHPWIYDGSITEVSHDGAAGDLAVVFDERRRFAAIGLWDPTSPIRVKVLHSGTPTPIDDAFWSARLSAAIARRASLADAPATDAYRLVHGENDGLPGLVVDRYANMLVVKLYTPAWFPHLRSVVGALPDLPVVLRLSRGVAAGPTHGLRDGDPIVGRAPTEPVVFRENGLWMGCSPTRGQKTGHFLDQRDNRAAVRELAQGARVLDVFSCTGGFTVHAAAGGARSVHSVDLSPHAIESTRDNLGRNGFDVEHRATVGDAFAVMTELTRTGEQFDLVVIDPPSFAPRRDRVAAALDAYARLARLGVDLTRPGGVLVQASCSSQIDAGTFIDKVHHAAAARGATLSELRRSGHPPDHPVGFPQGAYLKALFARVDH